MAANNEKIIIAGSSWQPEEKLVCEFANKNSTQKIIFVPHDISENHLKNINLFNYGLGQNKKQVYLQIKKDNKSLGPRCEISEVFISEEGASYQPISLHSLDTIIPETSKISIIHLDVEGYELEVLKGAKRIIEKDAPIIILEIHSQALEYNNFMLQINYKPTDQLIYNFGSVVFVNTVYRLG